MSNKKFKNNISKKIRNNTYGSGCPIKLAESTEKKIFYRLQMIILKVALVYPMKKETKIFEQLKNLKIRSKTSLINEFERYVIIVRQNF